MAAKPATRLQGCCESRSAAAQSAAEPLHHLAVQCGEAAIERGQAALLMARQRREVGVGNLAVAERSEEHTSELQSLMRISYAVFCLKKKKTAEHETLSKVNSPTAST